MKTVSQFETTNTRFSFELIKLAVIPSVFLACAAFFIQSIEPVLLAEETFKPYNSDNVPRNVIDLWKDLDPQKDQLETKVIKEWDEDGIICRYVIFKVGTFKGKESRVAAFYTFPKGMKNGPAFVWAHGGGQRAERRRGSYFAKQGFATIDINWGGREIVEGITENTDWGEIDPTQGPRFYKNAKRKNFKSNVEPDEFTIDSIPSPRNGNWFLLSYVGRRAITFLEKQPEVDPARIGFTGYSMGGTITSMVAIDKRLKAAAPMVGGSGFRLNDFPGLPGSNPQIRAHRDPEMYSNTNDPKAYWPHVQCPVLFLSASNDFHSTFERVYKAMALVPHDNWRVSQKMHFNHSLGAEQWILLNRFFHQHLSGKSGQEVSIAKTPQSKLMVDKTSQSATFQVSPDSNHKVEKVDIYYSYDPNPRSRFWNSARSEQKEGTWNSKIPVRKNLPLFVFANCTYSLGKTVEAFQGTAENYTITSAEQVHLPEEILADSLANFAKPLNVFSDCEKDGYRDWGFGSRGGITTYKFVDPDRKTPGPEMALKVTIDAPKDRLSYRFRIKKNFFLTGVKGPAEDFSTAFEVKKAGAKTLLIPAKRFVQRDKMPMTQWENIQSFTVDVWDPDARKTLDFTEKKNRAAIVKIEWVAAPK